MIESTSKKFICIAGKNSVAVAGLNYIFKKYKDKYTILALCDDNDDGIDYQQPSFKKFAESKKIKIVDLEELYNIKNLCFISLEYFKLIKTRKFKTNKIFNIHFSLLPAYKGMYTSAHPILNNEKKTGCTFHLINDGIDTGEILFQRSFNITKKDTCENLYDKYIYNGIRLIYDHITDLVDNNFTPLKQSSEGSTYYSKSSINYKDLVLNTNVTAHQLGQQLKAFTFRYYQLPKINGKTIFGYKILKEQSFKKPGLVVDQYHNRSVLSTVDYNIEVYYDNFDLFINSVKENDLQKVKESLRDNPFVINERDKNGWTALIISCFKGNNQLIKLLLRMGADPNIPNFKRTFPLMYAKDFAQISGNTAGIEILLRNGADRKVVDIFNKSIFDYLNEDNPYYNKIMNALNKYN